MTESLPSPEPSVAAQGDSARDSVPPAKSRTRRLPAHLGFTAVIASLIAVASLMMVFWNLQDASLKNANTGSRYATVESLVDHGTFYIDKSRYVRTIDKMKVDGHFISSKPPTLSTYAAGLYWVYQKLTGKTIADYEGDVVRFVSFGTGWFFHLLFLIYFYRFCQLLLRRRLAILGAMLAAGFSYLGVAYATAINNHSVAASLALMGFYYAYRIRNRRAAKLQHWVFCGLCFGFLPAVDLPSWAFVPFVGLYLLTFDWKRTLLWFVPAMLPGIIVQFALLHAITGSFEPTYLNSDLKDFPENYFKGRQQGIDALREPKHIYAFHVLLGHHGLFSMTPLYLFGLWELGRSLWRRVRLPEVLFTIAVLIPVFGFYIFRTRNYGGWCVGMRWLVPIMPLFLLFFAQWLDRVRLTRTLWALVLAAFAVGAFHVQDGLTSPFQFSVWHNWIDGTPNRGRVGTTLNLGRKYERDQRQKRHDRSRKASSRSSKKSKKKANKKK